eukprot:6492711-Amphidinium_carterae.1
MESTLGEGFLFKAADVEISLNNAVAGKTDDPPDTIPTRDGAKLEFKELVRNLLMNQEVAQSGDVDCDASAIKGCPDQEIAGKVGLHTVIMTCGGN